MDKPTCKCYERRFEKDNGDYTSTCNIPDLKEINSDLECIEGHGIVMPNPIYNGKWALCLNPKYGIKRVKPKEETDEYKELEKTVKTEDDNIIQFPKTGTDNK